MAEFLFSIGFPSGNRTDKEFLMPNWIMTGSEEIRSNFLSGFFDAEGSVYPGENKTRWRLCINQHKKIEIANSGLGFMNQLRELLSYFNIESASVGIQKGKVRKDGTKTVRLFFEVKKRSLENFYRFVGFENPYKQEKLVLALSVGTQAVKGTDS